LVAVFAFVFSLVLLSQSNDVSSMNASSAFSSSTRSGQRKPSRRTGIRPQALLVLGLLAACVGGGLWWNATQGPGSKWVVLKHWLQPSTQTLHLPPETPLAPAHPEVEGAVVLPKGDEVAVYFSNTQPTIKSKAVIRQLPDADATSVERLRFAVESLLQGPQTQERQAGAISEIPSGTKLLGVTENGPAITINLSPEFASGDGATSVQRRVDELAKTIRAIEMGRPVYLAIQGKPLKTLSTDGLELEGPINQTPMP
jgi:Sporulation and spore germination